MNLPAHTAIANIARLLDDAGGRQYGREAVSQRDHALQCAQLAEEAGESAETIAAALLHDLGHLLAPAAHPAEAPDPLRDDLHQYIALPFLRATFPDAVIEPIRLHVDAKRYLCATEPAYGATLSLASVQSLAVKDGPFTDVEARAFMAQPFAAAAVRLRRYDDHAKTPGRTTRPLLHYVAVLKAVARQAPAGA